MVSIESEFPANDESHLVALNERTKTRENYIYLNISRIELKIIGKRMATIEIVKLDYIYGCIYYIYVFIYDIYTHRLDSTLLKRQGG